tara:strand:+ start:815 stop:1009 length:195 start_codon:yes stop_codon:yes gene_type:complete
MTLYTQKSNRMTLATWSGLVTHSITNKAVRLTVLPPFFYTVALAVERRPEFGVFLTPTDIESFS